MTPRVSVLVVFVALAIGSSGIVAREKHWDPATAVADARRDIAHHRIRFCYIGGYVPHPIGTPDSSYGIISRYPRIEVGDQGCNLAQHSDDEHEYARLYNEEMWRYVSRKPR